MLKIDREEVLDSQEFFQRESHTRRRAGEEMFFIAHMNRIEKESKKFNLKMFLPEVIDSRLAQVAKHVAARLTVAFPYCAGQ
jgi:hypothetical protein